MVALNKSKELLLSTFLIVFYSGYAQSHILKKEINDYVESCNLLIQNINENIEALDEYQNQLNAWYLNSNMSSASLPSFHYKSFDYTAEINTLIGTHIKAPNYLIDYHSDFSMFYKQCIVFNTLSKQLNQKSSITLKEKIYKEKIGILKKLGEMASNMVDLGYNFSQASAIAFGVVKTPQGLENLKRLISQAKNVIMEMRFRNPQQVRWYLSQLNEVNKAVLADKDLDALRKYGNFRINIETLTNDKRLIVNAVNLVAYWAEQYIQSKQAEENLQTVLTNAIKAFNGSEEIEGCAKVYNSMITKSSNTYLHFTKEPLLFEINIEPFFHESISAVKQPANPPSSTVKKDTVYFNPHDINTLAGSKPNNIIFLMDISASMRASNRLNLLKESIMHLVKIMRPEDRISLVAYSGEAKVLLKNISKSDFNTVKNVLDTLKSMGGTDIVNGLQLGYDIVYQNFIKSGNNKIILATDGAFGVRSNLLRIVEKNQQKGVPLSVLQYNGNKSYLQNAGMKMLSVKGKGTYHVLTNKNEAISALISEVKTL